MSSSPITVAVTSGNAAPLPVTNATCLFGISSSGTASVPVSVGSIKALTDTFGQGPLVDAAALYLQISGQPVYVCRVAQAAAGTIGSFTKTAIGTFNGTVADNSSAPVNQFSLVIVIVTTGTVAAGTFNYRYSTDGGNNYSAIIAGPQDGSGSANVSIGTTGISVTFADGGATAGFEAGDIFSALTVWPTYNTSGLSDSVTALIDEATIRVRRIHAVGTNGSTFHSTLITLAGTTALAGYKYIRAIEESDDLGSAETVSAWQTGVLSDFATSSNRTAIIAGWQQTLLQTQQDGINQQRNVPIAWTTGAEIAAADISQDPGRAPSIEGPLPNTVVNSTYAIRQDGRIFTSLEGQGYTYGQSYVGLDGLYCAGAFTRIANSNDVYFMLPRCQVIDMLCEQMYQQSLSFLNTSVVTNADGTISEQAAQAIEGQLNTTIEDVAVNVSPQRISPTASGEYVTVDRTNNISVSGELLVTITVVPLGYISTVSLTIGYQFATSS